MTSALSDLSDLPSVGPGPAALAVDVGGTAIKAARVDPAGVLHDLVLVPTPVDRAGSADAVVATVAQIAGELTGRSPSTPTRAGVVVPGVVDDEAGVGVFSENLYWRDVPFASRFTTRLAMPTRVMHDVRGAGLAEYRLGVGREYGDVMVLAIGTGIAGAVFTDGHLYPGGGFAGEVGHTRVADAPACVCGGVGCLEAIASAAAIARRYAERTGRTEHVVDGAREVLAAMASGDGDAALVWGEALDALTVALAQVAAILAPEAILVAGGLSRAGEALLDPLRARLDSALTFHRRPVLRRAAIGAHAGLLGAALLTREDPRHSDAPRAW